jgi:hypothetical protein
VNFSRLCLGLGFAALFALATAAAGVAQYGPPPDLTPPSVFPSSAASPVPSASPSGRPIRGHRAPRPGPSASAEAPETPAPPQFNTLDGTWEIEVQPLMQRLADYSYMSIISNGSTLTGTWVQRHGKFRNTKAPMAGTFDGRLISMTVLMPDGDTATFSGYVENFGDMVGIYAANAKDPGTAFTAEHRKRL